MNTLDQRILIPAPQTSVWAVISDLLHSGAWNADWQQVGFLTTKREGRATRFRCRDAKGKETVVEITAWYNGLGYEYAYIDGIALKNPVGRIRLQEIPEGTIVQWTFQWEGSRGAARKLESRIEDNLKALYRQVTQVNRQSMTESKSVMRDGVSVGDRSQYQSRYPSAVQTATPAPPPSEEFTFDDLEAAPSPGGFDFSFAEPPVRADDAQMVAAHVNVFDLSSEPPVKDDDTRPRPPISAIAEQLPTLPPLPDDFSGEPDFLDDLILEVDSPIGFGGDLNFDFEVPPLPSADQSMGAPQERVVVDVTGVTDVIEDISALFLNADAPAQVLGAAPSPTESAPATAEPQPATSEQPPTRTDIPPTTPLTPIAADEVKSIWEIFGVPRPTETSEQARLTDTKPPAISTDQPVAQAERLVEPSPTSEDTSPLEIVDTEPESAHEDAVLKPPPGLMEALESLRLRSESPADRPRRRGGHRARMRVQRVQVRRPL